jgi:hypothetical protein
VIIFIVKIYHAMVRIGLFGIGLDTYWDQFDVLLNMESIQIRG